MNFGIVNVMGVDVNLFAIVLVLILVYIFHAMLKASKKGKLDWLDLITKDNSKKVSSTKIFNIVGAIVSTWLTIYMGLKGTLTWDFYMIYLAFTSGNAMFSKALSMRYGSSLENEKDGVPPVPGMRMQNNDNQDGSTVVQTTAEQTTSTTVTTTETADTDNTSK